MKLSEIPKINREAFPQFTLFAGPCVIESESSLSEIAEKLLNITAGLNIPFVLKASFKKGNRTKHYDFSTIGDETALSILQNVGRKFNIPTMTDVHSRFDARLVDDYEIDIIQIPAMLSRQTDIIQAAANTGKIVNIKKGQFMSGFDINYVVGKVIATGHHDIILTERGTAFGYNDLVVDMRNVPIMQATGCPVIVDITHSLGTSDGDPKMIRMFGRMAIASGADGIFLETHPNPAKAKSDGNRMLMLNNVPTLLRELLTLNR